MFGFGVTQQFNHGPALQEHSYIAPVARYRGSNEFKRYPYDLMGQPVSVGGENDTSKGDKKSEDPDDETALEGSKRFGYLHEERELSRVVNMWTRRATGQAKRPRSVRQLEELLQEEADDPIPELDQLYGEEINYEVGRSKLIFRAQQRFVEEEQLAKEAAARAALGYIEESETEEDTEDEDTEGDDGEEGEEEHLTSLTLGETVQEGGEEADEEEEDNKDDENKSVHSKGSKYSTATGVSMTSWDIERRARKKRYARAKEYRLKMNKNGKSLC